MKRKNKKSIFEYPILVSLISMGLFIYFAHLVRKDNLIMSIIVFVFFITILLGEIIHRRNK